MTEYYYLDQNQETKGPHSFEELQQFFQEGKLSSATLVSTKGSSRWYSLISLINKLRPASGVVEGAPGLCPTCHGALEMDGPDLPPVCPSCGRRLRPEKEGIWSNFKLALSQYARFSGRATRAEYWSYILVSTLISLFFYMLAEAAGIMAVASMEASLTNMQGSPREELFVQVLQSAPMTGMSLLFFAAIILYVLSGLFFIIPSFSVMTRRLHDVGWSGWWIVAMYAPLLLVVGGSIGCVYLLSGANPVEAPDLQTMIAVILISYLVMLIIGILIFVLSLLDSRRGPNKYGPSRKYPMG